MIIQTGLAVSPYVKITLGFLLIFGISMGCAISAMIWAIFGLMDSQTMRLSEISKEDAETKECSIAQEEGYCKHMTSMFDIRNIKRAFSVTFRRRSFNTRPFLLILASNFILYVVMINGRDYQLYLYTREAKCPSNITYCVYIILFCYLVTTGRSLGGQQRKWPCMRWCSVSWESWHSTLQCRC